MKSRVSHFRFKSLRESVRNIQYNSNHFASCLHLTGLLVTQMLSGLFASAVAPVSQSLVSENVQEGLMFILDSPR